jgi:hypothetical protein
MMNYRPKGRRFGGPLKVLLDEAEQVHDGLTRDCG